MQASHVTEFLPTRTNVLQSEVLRFDVALAAVLMGERLRAEGTHESLLSVDHRFGRRPVEILKSDSVGITQTKYL